MKKHIMVYNADTKQEEHYDIEIEINKTTHKEIWNDFRQHLNELDKHFDDMFRIEKEIHNREVHKAVYLCKRNLVKSLLFRMNNLEEIVK